MCFSFESTCGINFVHSERSHVSSRSIYYIRQSHWSMVTVRLDQIDVFEAGFVGLVRYLTFSGQFRYR